MPLNVVLVIADALRRDCVGAFNSAYRHTPGLDERLAGWHLLERCYSAAPWTLPSVTTLLTGVSASRHGEFFHRARDSRWPSLPELLPPSYRKIGVVNNANLTELLGFSRGFDEYAYTADLDEPFALAKEALQRIQGERPYFLLLHSNLAHDYFRRSTERYYNERFPDRHDWFEMAPRVISWQGVTPLGSRRVRSFYDACVAQLDERLSSVLDLVDLSDTVVCLVADHGEGLEPEIARVHHGGRVHDDLVNVPACLHLPPTVDARHHDRLRARAASSVWSADLVPTLLELVGCKAPADLDGRSLVGDDDSPRTIEIEDRRFLYLRTRDRLNVNREGKHTTRAMRYRNNVLQATAGRKHNLKGFVRFPYKLIVTSVVPPQLMSPALGPVVRALLPSRALVLRRGAAWFALELFDLDADPGERHNLLDGHLLADALARLGAIFDRIERLEVIVGDSALDLRAALRA